ncbi:MAG TPA: Ig-like domain-containing protein [Gemmatimonadaceae bacterium]|jgi:hypothetical protein
MRILSIVALGLAVVVAACSSDSTTTSTTTTSGDSSTSAAGLTLVADTAALGNSVAAGSTVPVTVHVFQGTAPAGDVLVSWTVNAGGGTVAAPTTLTDSNGVATIGWTVGDTITTNTMTADIVGANVTITTVTVAGPTSTLTRVSPDSQAVVAGAGLTITARPVDRFGNPVQGVTVTWSATGGTLSAAATTSGNLGDATTNFITDATPGTYQVTASVAGRASVTFTIVGS